MPDVDPSVALLAVDSWVMEVVDVYKPNAIFTPGSYPVHTYVAREAEETRLWAALDVDGMLVSVAGPTKTGKTVLVEQVVGRDRFVSVSGGLIDSAEDVWKNAAEALGMPDLRQPELVPALIDEEYSLVIDDFHYVSRSTQQRIAQQLKDAVAKGLRVIVISVPHRADDTIRGNPDLRGRVMKVDLDYWDRQELTRIAEIGFPLLNVDVANKTLDDLTRHSLRAPQLMHLLCLEVCRFAGITEPQEDRLSVRLSQEDFRRVATEVAGYTDSASVHQVLRQGPAVRGRERTEHEFSDGTSGDVYELVLRAMCEDPPTLSFPMPELKLRVSRVLRGGSAAGLGGSVANTVRNMHKIVNERMPNERVIEWDEERQTVDILDPYFAYYLRWGSRP